MANKEVKVGDDWYLGENNDGDLIVYNAATDEERMTLSKMEKVIDFLNSTQQNLGGVMANPLTEDVNADKHSINTVSSLGFNAGGRMRLPTRGFIQGLLLANNSTNPNYQVDIGTGLAMLKDQSTEAWDWMTEITSTITVDISISGVNGLEASDIEAASTWYEVYLIDDSSGTNSPAGLLNEAETAIGTFPSGYDKYRRIGYIRNNSASNIFSFFNGVPGWFWWEEKTDHEILDTTSPATTWTTVDCSNYIPPSNQLMLLQRFLQDNGGGGDTCFLQHRQTGATGSFQMGLTFPNEHNNYWDISPTLVQTDESHQIDYKTKNSNVAGFRAVGWFDSRGD